MKHDDDAGLHGSDGPDEVLLQAGAGTRALCGPGEPCPAHLASHLHAGERDGVAVKVLRFCRLVAPRRGPCERGRCTTRCLIRCKYSSGARLTHATSAAAAAATAAGNPLVFL